MGGRFAQRPGAATLRALQQALADARTLEPQQPLLEADLLERVGLAQAQRNECASAEASLRAAISLDQQFPTWKRSQRHQILAAVIAKAGRLDEATAHYRRGLALAEADTDADDDMALYARWFLANHLERTKAYAEALALLPDEVCASVLRRPVRAVRALCFKGLGRMLEARAEAADALAACTSKELHSEMREWLGDLLD